MCLKPPSKSKLRINNLWDSCFNGEFYPHIRIKIDGDLRIYYEHVSLTIIMLNKVEKQLEKKNIKFLKGKQKEKTMREEGREI